MTVGSSVEKISPPSKPKGVVEACGDAFGTGGTIPRCEASYGESSSISAICWACGRARLNHEAQPIRVRAVIGQLKPMRPPLLLTEKKHFRGDHGSVARILIACGTGRGIMRLLSILPGSAWHIWSPIRKPSGTCHTA